MSRADVDGAVKLLDAVVREARDVIPIDGCPRLMEYSR